MPRQGAPSGLRSWRWQGGLQYNPMAVAFFDFDKTLLSVNSAWLWVRRELRLGHVSRWQALRAGLWMARYQLGFLSLDDALREVIGSLSGVEVKAVQQRTADFYASELK